LNGTTSFLVNLFVIQFSFVAFASFPKPTNVVPPDVVFSNFDSYYGTLAKIFLGDENHDNLEMLVHGSKDWSNRSALDVKNSLYLQPHGIAAYPVFDSLDKTIRRAVGYMFSIISWDLCVYRLLPNGVNGIIVIFQNTCGQAATYRINGPNVSIGGLLVVFFHESSIEMP
jgi:hypothetical protein